MLIFLTIVVMLFVAFTCVQEGVFTSVCTLINIMLAGLLTYWAFEPLADEMEVMFSGTFLEGFEDCLCMVGLFCLSFGLLRLATNSLAYTVPDYADYLNRGGALVVGLLAGYLLAGFLIVAISTLPFPKNSEQFDTRIDPTAANALVRSRLPPDRLWLALMQHASLKPLVWEGHTTFDPNSNFLLRYYRYHRKEADGKLLKYDGGTPER